MRSFALLSLVALLAVAACRNSANKAFDTLGVGGGTAAGQALDTTHITPPVTPAATPPARSADTTRRDTGRSGGATRATRRP